MSIKDALDFQVESNVKHKILIKNGYKIHYFITDSKQKETIFFIHSAFSDHTCFNKQIDFFSKSFNVISIDLLGHGLSKVGKSKDKIDKSIEHINDILQKENIETIHIVGVSIGALIAQCFAEQHMEKTLSLTAVGGYDISRKSKEVDKTQRKEIFKLIFKIIFSMDSFRRYLSSISVINETERILFYESTKGFSRKSFTIMSGSSKFISEKTDTRPYPLLILVGDKDQEIAKKMSEQWYKEQGHKEEGHKEEKCEFHFIKNAGHCANMDNSEMFNKTVYDFILRSIIK